MSSLDEVRRKYNFPDLFIASWRDPALSVHPARGGAGSPGFASYKVNYDHLPQPTDDEASEDDSNTSDTEKQGNVDGSEAPVSDQKSTADKNHIVLPPGESSAQDEELDLPDFEVDAHLEAGVAEVQGVNAELLEEMAGDDSPTSTILETTDEVVSKGQDQEGGSGAVDSLEEPDDTSDDRRVSFAPGTPDPKPTHRKKKAAKGTKGKKKRIAVPLDSLPADVVAMIDAGFDGQLPPAPDPPTDGPTAEGHPPQHDTSASEVLVGDPALEDGSGQGDPPPSAHVEAVPNEAETIEGASDVTLPDDEAQKPLIAMDERLNESASPTDGLPEGSSVVSAGPENQEKEDATLAPNVTSDEQDGGSAQESPIPDSGIDIAPVSEKPSKKKSSKSIKDRKNSSRARTKQPSTQPAGLGIDTEFPKQLKNVDSDENKALPAADLGAEVGPVSTEDVGPNASVNGINEAVEATAEMGDSIEIGASPGTKGDVDEATVSNGESPSGDPPGSSIEQLQAGEANAAYHDKQDSTAVADEVAATAGDDSPESHPENPTQNIVKEVDVRDALETASVDNSGSSADIVLEPDGEAGNDVTEHSEASGQPSEQAEQDAEPVKLAGSEATSAEDKPSADGTEQSAEPIECPCPDGSEGDDAAVDVASDIREDEGNEVVANVEERPVSEPLGVVERIEGQAAEEEKAGEGEDKFREDNGAGVATDENNGEGFEATDEPESVATEDKPSMGLDIEAAPLEVEAKEAELEIVDASPPAAENPDAPPPKSEPVVEAPKSPPKSKRGSHESHKHKAESWKRKHTERPFREVFEHAAVLQRPHDRSQRSKDAIRVTTRDSRSRRLAVSGEVSEERRKRKDAREAEAASHRAGEERSRAQSEEHRRTRRAVRRAADAADQLEKDAAAMEAEAQQLRLKQQDDNEGRPRRGNKVTLPSFALPSIPKSLNLTSGESVHGPTLLKYHGKVYRPTSSSGSSKEESGWSKGPRDSERASPPASKGERARRRHRHHHHETEEGGDRSYHRQRDGERRTRRGSVNKNASERPISFLGMLMRRS